MDRNFQKIHKNLKFNFSIFFKNFPLFWPRNPIDFEFFGKEGQLFLGREQYYGCHKWSKRRVGTGFGIIPDIYDY